MSKKVNVLYGYRGARTDYKYLPKGEHVLEDSLADYLIENTHAVLIEESEPKPKRASKKTSDDE